MSEAIGPGSVVECVNATPDPGYSQRLVQGAIYRVSSVARPDEKCTVCGRYRCEAGFWISGLEMECTSRHHGSFRASRFRPIGGSAQSIDEIIHAARDAKVKA